DGQRPPTLHVTNDRKSRKRNYAHEEFHEKSESAVYSIAGGSRIRGGPATAASAGTATSTPKARTESGTGPKQAGDATRRAPDDHADYCGTGLPPDGKGAGASQGPADDADFVAAVGGPEQSDPAPSGGGDSCGKSPTTAGGPLSQSDSRLHR